MIRRFWTAAEESKLRELYPDTSTKKLARILHRSAGKIYQHANRMGLRKSTAYLAGPDACRLRRGDHIGKATQFPKGHVPANKGLRLPGWAPGRMAETQFKAGERGTKWVPIGSTRICDGYQYTKVKDIRSTKSGAGFVPWTQNWKPTHVLLWSKRHGKVPRGHALLFRNGDRTDIRLGNLKLVHRRELMHRNSVQRLPKDLRIVVQLRGALVRRIRRLSAEE